MDKLTIHLFQQLARSRGGECLSTEYVNWDTPLRWRCSNNHEWTNRAGKIKSGQWCPTCAGKAPKGLAFLHDLAAAQGGHCLSEEYSGMQGAALWACAEGHQWLAKPNNIRYGTWCPYCRGKRQSVEDLQALAADRGGECLSDQYVGQAKKYRWRCAVNHVWTATANSLRNGSWCPLCKVSYGEEICRIYLEAVFERPFPKARPAFLRAASPGALELDGFCEELMIAFEHHGLQHYRRIGRFQPTEIHFEEQLRRDHVKRSACQEAGVRLIEIPAIPEMTTIEEIPGVVKSQLLNHGILPLFNPPIKSLDLAQAYRSSALDDLRTIAHERGGILLGDTYLGDRGKLLLRCAKGHEWRATARALKNGAWCALCYGNVKKTLEDVQSAALARGITLLSTEYLGTNRKLRWQCAAGHEWDATPSRVTNGQTSCPRCANQNKTIDDMRALAALHNGSCQSHTYEGQYSKLAWTCAQGHEFSMTPIYLSTLKEEWCPMCREEIRRAKRVDTRMTALREKLVAKGGQVVHGDYRDPHTKFTFQCTHRHQWTTSYDSIMRGTWCPECYRTSRTHQL